MKNKTNPKTFGSRWRYVLVLFALILSVGVSTLNKYLFIHPVFLGHQPCLLPG